MAGFGDELVKLMTDKGLSQRTLAVACGVNPTFISKLVRGERGRLGADVLYKLCDALGVGCDHFRPFLTGEDEQPEPEPAAKKADKKPKGKKG
jgi:transcriptional regulator with XRE-family HTH domain